MITHRFHRPNPGQNKLHFDLEFIVRLSNGAKSKGRKFLCCPNWELEKKKICSLRDNKLFWQWWSVSDKIAGSDFLLAVFCFQGFRQAMKVAYLMVAFLACYLFTFFQQQLVVSTCTSFTKTSIVKVKKVNGTKCIEMISQRCRVVNPWTIQIKQPLLAIQVVVF